MKLDKAIEIVKYALMGYCEDSICSDKKELKRVAEAFAVIVHNLEKDVDNSVSKP